MAKDLNDDPTEEKLSRINAAGLINMTLEGLWKESYTAMLRPKGVLKKLYNYYYLGKNQKETDNNAIAV